MKFVVAGAYYYDRADETIISPHYTGEFFMVDCDEYVRMEELKGRYDESYINQVKDNPIEFEGEKYYDAEYNPFNVGDWELISDLSELRHLEENFDW